MKTSLFVRYALAALASALLFGLLVGYVVTPKPWYERFFWTLWSAGGFGALGALAGFVVGGVGVALLGTAVGVPAALLFGVTGMVFGTGIGSVVSIALNPRQYNFDVLGLVGLFVACGTVFWCVIAYRTTWFKRKVEELRAVSRRQ
jgi:hypothetical protein